VQDRKTDCRNDTIIYKNSRHKASGSLRGNAFIIKKYLADIEIQLSFVHQYYTPFFTKIQVNLAKTAFFVDYDGYLC